MEQVFLIALGSNLGSRAGDRAETLRAALHAIAAAGATIRRVSRFYATPCFPAGAGPDYVNACATVRHDVPPHEMLHILHEIEARFDRERKNRWGARTLDLDLLAMGETLLPDAQGHAKWRNLPPDQQTQVAPDQLILPHPRLQDRGFVLVPLLDIVPDWRHPVLGQTVTQMCAALPAALRDEVVPL